MAPSHAVIKQSLKNCVINKNVLFQGFSLALGVVKEIFICVVHLFYIPHHNCVKCHEDISTPRL